MKKTIVSIIFLATSLAFAGNRLNAEWEYLFDGNSLDNWEQRGGEATYAIKDNMIIGTTKVGTPNSFLCTKQKYANFIFEVEFWVDDELNSGIQIRSNSIEEYKNGRVHGYQIEIDPSERAWSAGIYDEARRGWLYDLKFNEAARNAFKHEAWNTYHIEAIGNSIRTWINGVPAANLIDGMTANGFIALQVHSHKKEGLQVKWRNIRILDLGTTTEYPPVIKTSDCCK